MGGLTLWRSAFGAQVAALVNHGHLANPATYMVYPLRDFVEVGGLISYGSDIVDALRQAGQYVGRIIKGAKPAELPIVKADKFDLVINAQTARMLGLTVPSSLLSRADEIID